MTKTPAFAEAFVVRAFGSYCVYTSFASSMPSMM